VLNALAAVAVGLERGVKAAEAVGALATLTPADKRGQVFKWITSRQSTIATIRIRRRWKQWWMH